jgi:uncharacterized membrane protein YkvA (DUF1232 family)
VTTRLLAGLVLVADSWLLLAALARRLPTGLARDLVGFLPDCAMLLGRLWRDSRVPRRARAVLALAAVWVVSPVDLVPEVLPVIGALDDVVVAAVALRYAVRRVPRDAVVDAWPGSATMLRRLLGDSTTANHGARAGVG